MALGRRSPKQSELFIPAATVARVAGHPFYRKLNALLAEADFDPFVEDLCAPYYKEGGRPGIPPGVYFRMLLVGYFEGLESQRGIAWRCADSLALRAFLGYALTDPTPVHASMSEIRQRLPATVFQEVFVYVLGVLEAHGLLQGKTLGIDATTLEANAAMKSIVRRETGEGWTEYLRKLAQAEGITAPTAEDLRRLDRGRSGKKVSNDEWHSPSDPEARITKMKDGTTHLAYKAEHAVDLATEAIVAVQVAPGDQSDPQSGRQTLALAQEHLRVFERDAAVPEAVMDKGYHDNGLLAHCATVRVRTYIPERRQAGRCWTDKPPGYEGAFRANRRRVRGERGRRLSRRRSEVVERTFAHVCETGGGRRSWLRGLLNVTKAHLLRCAGYNLGLLLRRVWGMSKPRSWAVGLAAAAAALLWVIAHRISLFLTCLLAWLVLVVAKRWLHSQESSPPNTLQKNAVL